MIVLYLSTFRIMQDREVEDQVLQTQKVYLLMMKNGHILVDKANKVSKIHFYALVLIKKKLFIDRSSRPSDSSVENDMIVFTYAQRFLKVPEENKCTETDTDENAATKPVRQVAKRMVDLHLEEINERNKDTQSSDTENASPAIGCKDKSSVS